MAQRIISTCSPIGSSSPMPVFSGGSACSLLSTSIALEAMSVAVCSSAVFSIRCPSTRCMRMNGLPSMTGSLQMTGTGGVGRPASCSAAMMRPCRITSAVAAMRAPGGGRRSTYSAFSAVTKYVKPECPSGMRSTLVTRLPSASSRSARICSSPFMGRWRAAPEGQIRSFEVGDVADGAGHSSVAEHTHRADARVVGEDAQPPRLELHDVREAGDDRSAVAHHHYPPALMVAHDIVDYCAHPGRRRVRRLLEVKDAVVRDVERHLDQALIHLYVGGDGPRGLHRTAVRARVDRCRSDAVHALRQA